MGLPWFRCYVDFLTDPKMVSIAFEDQRHFLAICALKAKGTLDQECPPDVLDRIVAQQIWVDFSIIKDVKNRLIEAGLVNDSWIPLGWDKRQSKSDSSTDRVRKHREQKQQLSGCNDDETLQKRSGNALDKNRRDKSRKENTSKDSYETVANFVDEGLFFDFLKHRVRLKAYNTDRALTLLTNKLTKAHTDGEDVNMLIERSIENGWKTIFPIGKSESKNKDQFGGAL